MSLNTVSAAISKGLVLPKRGDILSIPELTLAPVKLTEFDPFTHEYMATWATSGNGFCTVTQMIKKSWFINNPSKWRFAAVAIKEAIPCAHSWRDYNGFTEKYRYCKICDEKDYTI